MVKLTYTINSGTRETHGVHRREPRSGLHQETRKVRGSRILVLVLTRKNPCNLLAAFFNGKITTITGTCLAGLVNKTDSTHNDF